MQIILEAIAKGGEKGQYLESLPHFRSGGDGGNTKNGWKFFFRLCE